MENLKEMGISDHLTCLLRNLYAGQEVTVRTGHGTTDWFQIGKGVRPSCIPLSPQAGISRTCSLSSSTSQSDAVLCTRSYSPVGLSPYSCRWLNSSRHHIFLLLYPQTKSEIGQDLATKTLRRWCSPRCQGRSRSGHCVS